MVAFSITDQIQTSKFITLYAKQLDKSLKSDLSNEKQLKSVN
jgi:hypothetical protein